MIILKMEILVECIHDFNENEVKKYFEADDAHLLLHSNKLGATIGKVDVVGRKDTRVFKENGLKSFHQQAGIE